MAGIRGAGKYNGVVFYDRWDNCYLFSGVYLMYIADTMKEVLRPFQGKSMEIDAKEVRQPMNPGDGVIERLEVIGESRPDSGPIITPDIRGVALTAALSAPTPGYLRALVEIRNEGSALLQIQSDSLGFAVLAYGPSNPMLICPTAGTSCAVITRVSATSPSGGKIVGSQTWSWAFDEADRLPDRFTLSPGERRTLSVYFDLQAGQYQFIAGYGGGVHAGPAASSNAVSFVVPNR